MHCHSVLALSVACVGRLGKCRLQLRSHNETQSEKGNVDRQGSQGSGNHGIMWYWNPIDLAFPVACLSALLLLLFVHLGFWRMVFTLSVKCAPFGSHICDSF